MAFSFIQSVPLALYSVAKETQQSAGLNVRRRRANTVNALLRTLLGDSLRKKVDTAEDIIFELIKGHTLSADRDGATTGGEEWASGARGSLGLKVYDAIRGKIVDASVDVDDDGDSAEEGEHGASNDVADELGYEMEEVTLGTGDETGTRVAFVKGPFRMFQDI